MTTRLKSTANCTSDIAMRQNALRNANALRRNFEISSNAIETMADMVANMDGPFVLRAQDRNAPVMLYMLYHITGAYKHYQRLFASFI